MIGIERKTEPEEDRVLVKRTRRDLSNPVIRRILQSERFPGSRADRKLPGPVGRFFRISGLSILTLLVLFNTLVLLKTTEWKRLELLTLKEKSRHLPETAQAIPPTGRKGIASRNPEPSNRTGSADPTPSQETSGSAARETPRPKPVTRKIQVEVLNGCGVEGIASRMTDYLRDQGIDVVDNRNYKHFNVEKTFILNRSGNTQRVQKVARLIGLSEKRIQLQKNMHLQLDATIVLGRDYKTFKPFKNE